MKILCRLFLLLIPFALAVGCRPVESYLDDPGASLSFNTDTVLFDTLFTTVGSATQNFKVYNRHNKALLIQRIELAGGAASNFRINVDGVPATELSNLTLRANDSMYIFVDVNIDPNNLQTPFIVEDSIVFVTNGNVQDVNLVAFGQNAHFLVDSVLPCNVTWTNDLPYVIYGGVLVPQGCKLTIQQGVKVHTYNNGIVLVNGTMEVLGTEQEPVIFEGVRPEADFKEQPNQWFGIRFQQGSDRNIMRHAVVKNAIIGIEVDSLPANLSTANLVLENCQISNMSAVGLLGFTAHINATNTLISNCGQYLVAADYGGSYNFYHCTFANYATFTVRRNPSVIFTNRNFINEQQGINRAFNLTANIINTILYGTQENELALDNSGSGQFNVLLQNNLLRTTLPGIPPQNNNILNKNPRFVSIPEKNFKIDSLSPAIDNGIQLNIAKDLEGKQRDAQPDIGAYEYQP